MKRLLLFTFLMFLAYFPAKAQYFDLLVVKAKIVEGDTIPLIDLPQVNIRGFIIFYTIYLS